MSETAKAACLSHIFWRVHGADMLSDVMQMGKVVFGSCKEYHSAAEWAEDATLHCVSEDSPFAFQEGK